LSTPSSSGDVLYRRWLSPEAPPPSPLISGVAAIISQPNVFADELEAVRCLRDAGFMVVYAGTQPDIGVNELRLLNNAGARIALKLGEDVKMVPDLVFIASGAEDGVKLTGKEKRAKLVSGLSKLRRILTSHFNFVETDK
jgi:hypothetical protein